MDTLKLAAVGSSLLVAEEIRSIAKAFLDDWFPIRVVTTDHVRTARPDTFYLCATTQGYPLRQVVPKDRLFVFDLEPVTTFFLAIAKIPAGETVYVFNNLLPYTEILTKRCQALGINQVTFRPIAFAEMKPGEIVERLRDAKYIIGVDAFVSENVLLSPQYRPFLRPDAVIIPGKRMATIPSACRLLAAIADVYLDQVQKNGADPAVAEELAQFNAYLKRAAVQLVMSQIGSTQATPPDPVSVTSDASIQEQIRTLTYLRDKIRRLAAS